MDSIWHDLMVSGIPIAEKVIRTIAVYGFLIAGLRLFGKRELGQLNPLDFIVLLLLSNTVQNAIIGNDNSLAGGLIGALVLMIVNSALVRWTYSHPRARRLVEGRSEELVKDGHVLVHALAHNQITREELLSAARKQGIEHMGDVACARLEVSGALSFLIKEPTELQRLHADIVARLDAIEKRLAVPAILLALAAFAPRASAQGGTDVWIVPMKMTGVAVSFGDPRNATDRKGYDNQPSFTLKSDAVMYTSVDDAGKTDIWRFTLPDGKPVRVTNIPMSVYSPTQTPDGKTFSVIRVEPDSTQRLWRVPMDGQGVPAKINNDLKVGYHVWTGDHSLVVYVLGSGGRGGTPSTLQIIDDHNGKAEIVASNVGRALAKIPGRDAVTFQQLVKDSLPWIVDLDLKTKAKRQLVQAPKGADYHVWAPNGALLTAVGSGIYRYTDDGWAPIANFEKFGVKGISRIAVSPKGNWLAFVAEDKPAP